MNFVPGYTCLAGKIKRYLFSLNPIVDQFSIDNPLNGILSAFQFNAEKSWLTVPVDMPNIGIDAIQFLIEHRDKEKIATCFYDSEGSYPEPLVTIWEKQSFLLLRTFYEQGGTSPRAFLKDNPSHVVQARDRNWLVNINTPEELDQWKTNRSHE